MKLGIVGLVQSRKATLSLLILCCATTALLLGKLDGTSYAAVIATVGTIYNWCQHKVDVASLPATPPRGTL